MHQTYRFGQAIVSCLACLEYLRTGMALFAGVAARGAVINVPTGSSRQVPPIELRSGATISEPSGARGREANAKCKMQSAKCKMRSSPARKAANVRCCPRAPLPVVPRWDSRAGGKNPS